MGKSNKKHLKAATFVLSGILALTGTSVFASLKGEQSPYVSYLNKAELVQKDPASLSNSFYLGLIRDAKRIFRESQKKTQDSWLQGPSPKNDSPEHGFYSSPKEMFWGPLLFSLRSFRDALFDQGPSSEAKAITIQESILKLMQQLPSGMDKEIQVEREILARSLEASGDLKAALAVWKSIFRDREPTRGLPIDSAWISIFEILRISQSMKKAANQEVLWIKSQSLNISKALKTPQRSISSSKRRVMANAFQKAGIGKLAKQIEGLASITELSLLDQAMRRGDALRDLHQIDEAVYWYLKAETQADKEKNSRGRIQALISLLKLHQLCQGCVLPDSSAQEMETRNLIKTLPSNEALRVEIALDEVLLAKKEAKSGLDLQVLKEAQQIASKAEKISNTKGSQSIKAFPYLNPWFQVRANLKVVLLQRALGKFKEVTPLAIETAHQLAQKTLEHPKEIELQTLAEQAFQELALILRAQEKWEEQAFHYQAELDLLKSEYGEASVKWGWRKISQAEAFIRSARFKEALEALDRSQVSILKKGPLEGMAHIQWLRSQCLKKLGNKHQERKALRSSVQWMFQLEPYQMKDRDPRPGKLLEE